jgi:nucleotide-binding universal stress UspA family protein
VAFADQLRLPHAHPEGFDPAAEATKVLDDAVAKLHAGYPSIEIHTSVTEGHTVQILVEASVGADLLVVGSRGHGEFTGMLLGSVSEHCIAHPHCPVLVFRH